MVVCKLCAEVRRGLLYKCDDLVYYFHSLPYNRGHLVLNLLAVSCQCLLQEIPLLLFDLVKLRLESISGTQCLDYQM